jgi:hypothetical protein
MEAYLRRARASLLEFHAAVDAFDAARPLVVPGPGRGEKQLSRLTDLIDRMRAAAKRLDHSVAQIAGENALDVVDLQMRMEGESAALGSALKGLGDVVDAAPQLLDATGTTLYSLEESAERVAAALFPNTIEGVREINRTLWDFRPLWQDYTRTLAREVARPVGTGLTSEQLGKVELAANTVRARFDDVNELLNQLVAGHTTNAAVVQVLVTEARQALADAVREASSRAAEVYKPFHAVLRRAGGLAKKIDGQFAGLRVPVFPELARLDDLTGVIDADRFASLAGVERFALFNIGARLRSITLGDGAGGHLLSPRFAIRVFDVFPDRIYFTADASFITAVEGLVRTRVFEVAPASLHRFRDGSFKQRQSRKGNLQVSYAYGSPEQPDDTAKVRVDADIDLYRSPTRHLFGEVLVNHLTGSKTDQFRVWDILASQQVAPLGGFQVVTV